MTLNTKNNERGFTIVELLIVIVVIAILAAITIVAYQGIQNRAKTSQYQSDAGSIVKVAEAINANPQDGQSGYPADQTAFNQSTDAKLPIGVKVVPYAKGTKYPVLGGADNKEKSYGITKCDAGINVYYTPAGKEAADEVVVKGGQGC